MLGTIFGIVDSETFSGEPDMSLQDDPSQYQFADYVSRNSVSLQERVEELRNFLVGCGCASYFTIQNDNEIVFKEGFKENYFHQKFETFMQHILRSDNFVKFCTDAPYTWELKRCIDREYDNYIADNYGSWETFDNFVRSLNYNTEYVVFDALGYK